MHPASSPSQPPETTKPPTLRANAGTGRGRSRPCSQVPPRKARGPNPPQPPRQIAPSLKGRLTPRPARPPPFLPCFTPRQYGRAARQQSRLQRNPIPAGRPARPPQPAAAGSHQRCGLPLGPEPLRTESPGSQRPLQVRRVPPGMGRDLQGASPHTVGPSASSPRAHLSEFPPGPCSRSPPVGPLPQPFLPWKGSASQPLLIFPAQVVAPPLTSC